MTRSIDDDVTQSSGARILANLPDATVLVDRAGDIVWVSPSGVRQMGVPIEEMVGTSCLDLIHPDDLPAALLALQSVQAKTVGTLIEVRIRTSDGWRLAEVLGSPIDGGDGGVVLTLRDLTERRRWEVAGDETAKLRTLVHHAPTLLVLVDAEGRIMASSGAITRALGYDQGQIERRPFEDLVTCDERPRLRAALDRARRAPQSRPGADRVEVSLRDARTDSHVPYELSIVNLLDDPTVRGLVVTGHDVSERTATEEDLRDMLSLLNATLDSTADGILVVDLQGRITSYNRRFVEMWQLPPEVMAGGDDDAAIRHVRDQLVDPDDFESRTQARYADAESGSFDVLTFRDGRVFERYSTPQRVGGQVVGRVWSFHDVTRQKQLEEELEHQAFHDSLTGLANQALFRDRVAHALDRASRDGTDLAVLYFDIDDFKRVNDSLGHRAGDDLLLAVAERLSSCVRAADTAARLGGDEFAVLLEAGDGRRQATHVAERLISRFREPVRIENRALIASVSIGIACAEPGMSSEQLLRNADLAMYAAKRQGKGGYELFAAGMHTEAVARLEMEGDLRAADVEREFWVAYQPVVELASGRIAGLEALVRWRHPVRGELEPEGFIGAAEDTGVIEGIGRFVFDRALGQARRWSERCRSDDFTVSVNVSPRQLRSGAVVAQVDAALRRHGVEPRHIVLELTETAMLQDTHASAQTLAELKALGVRLALDDFGTGFSSLTHLQRFPIDIIKIDRSFLSTTGADAALVRAVIRLSQELGLTAVAEGVETAEQVAFLQDAGCTFGQGYFYARPEPPDVIDGLLTRGPEPRSVRRVV